MGRPYLAVLTISRFIRDGLVYSWNLEVIKCFEENDRGRLLEYNKAAKVCRRYLLPVTFLDVYTLPIVRKINAKKFSYFIPMDDFYDQWS